MKKLDSKILLLVLNVLIFIFFIWFIYFSYFTAKELLVLKYISTSDYSSKFYGWDVDSCGDKYSFKYENLLNSELTESEKDKKFNEIKRDCLKNLEIKSENKKIVDFKFNFIKYGLATLFFFILFIVFSLQNLAFYNSEKKLLKNKKNINK